METAFGSWAKGVMTATPTMEMAAHRPVQLKAVLPVQALPLYAKRSVVTESFWELRLVMTQTQFQMMDALLPVSSKMAGAVRLQVFLVRKSVAMASSSEVKLVMIQILSTEMDAVPSV